MTVDKLTAARVTLCEGAANVIGVSRATLYRHLREGQTSVRATV
jgi:predicted site-specific integrase-resolvase